MGALRFAHPLCVSYAESRRIHGETRPAMASRFIQEIPAEHLTEVRLRGTVSQPVSARPQRGSGNGYRDARPAWGNTARQAAPTTTPRPAYNAWDKPAKAASENDAGLWVGQRVRHGKFGEGVITDLEGQGPRTRVQVKFAGAGSKWLMLDMAGLTPA